jgi:hypothetical protein
MAGELNFLCPQNHTLQQLFDPHQTLVTLNGEVERLAIQRVVAGIQERDQRR